jgi:hypothetical protein
MTNVASESVIVRLLRALSDGIAGVGAGAASGASAGAGSGAVSGTGAGAASGARPGAGAGEESSAGTDVGADLGDTVGAPRSSDDITRPFEVSAIAVSQSMELKDAGGPTSTHSSAAASANSSAADGLTSANKAPATRGASDPAS